MNIYVYGVGKDWVIASPYRDYSVMFILIFSWIAHLNSLGVFFFQCKNFPKSLSLLTVYTTSGHMSILNELVT